MSILFVCGGDHSQLHNLVRTQCHFYVFRSFFFHYYIFRSLFFQYYIFRSLFFHYYIFRSLFSARFFPLAFFRSLFSARFFPLAFFCSLFSARLWTYGPDDDLAYIDAKRIVLPIAAVQNILALAHSTHSGISKTNELCRSMYFWPGMFNDIK